MPPQTAPQLVLETLTPEAGAELLRKLGVQGKESDLRAASEELGNYVLALTLLGNYLRQACGGDVWRRVEVDFGQADERLGGKILVKVIRAYANWLGEGPELAVLRMLGLFDQSATKKALAALRAKPEIPGLTEPLMKTRYWWPARPLSEKQWQLTVSALARQLVVETGYKRRELEVMWLERRLAEGASHQAPAGTES